MAEQLVHLCKQCGYTGPVANAEHRGFMDALGGTGMRSHTTVECGNCGYWNWHVPPSGPAAGHEGAGFRMADSQARLFTSAVPDSEQARMATAAGAKPKKVNLRKPEG